MTCPNSNLVCVFPNLTSILKGKINSFISSPYINPTTGMMALKFILKYLKFKTLDIYGFDFFATKTWYNTKIDSGQKHSGRKEKVIFMNMIRDKKNVRFI